MKTGILTYFDTTNYGANLQAFALYEAIKNLGFKVEIINYSCENIKKRELKILNVNNGLKNFLSSVYHAPKKIIKHHKFYSFIKDHEQLSFNKYTKKNIVTVSNEYDKFLVGSDILWNFQINGYDTTFMLDFLTDNTKKYSFSTSIGTPWNQEEKRIASKYLTKFNRISVRELEAVKWVKEVSGKEVTLVCDPTMLITSKRWCELCSNKTYKDKYIFVYMAPKKCMDDAIFYAQNHGYKIRTLRTTDGIEDFLNLIKNAEVLFTGSYHGFLYALYFHTNLVFYNFQDKSRMHFLSKKFHIEDRDFMNIDINNFIKKEISDLDWENIDIAMQEFRNESVAYLKGILTE